MNRRRKLIERFTLNNYERAYVVLSNSLLSTMLNARKQYVLHELRHISYKHAILEVGCAFGGILREVIDAGYQNVSACDLDMDSLAKARIYVPEVPLMLCVAEQLTYGDQSKDVVICVGVLNYIQDPKKALTEIYRVLRRDGLLIISFGNAWSSARAIVQLGRLIKREQVSPRGFQYYAARQGKEMLHEAGFTLDREYYSFHVLPFEYRWTPDSKMGRRIEWVRKLLIKLVGSWWGSEIILIAHKAV